MTKAALTPNELTALVYQRFGHTAGSLFQEIFFLLKLKKGGIVRDGEKWIFKTAKELHERMNLSERTIRRHLSVLVENGWLKRFKWDASKRRDHKYYYALGDESKSRLDGDDTVPMETASAVLPDVDKPAASSKETEHNSNHSPVHTAARPEPKTERPKKTAARLTAERIAAERVLDKQLEEIDLSTRQGWIAAARAQAPILQKAQGFA